MYNMSWSAFPIGGRVSKFWSADLLLVRNKCNILSPLVGLSIICSMLWCSEMSMRRQALVNLSFGTSEWCDF